MKQIKEYIFKHKLVISLIATIALFAMIYYIPTLSVKVTSSAWNGVVSNSFLKGSGSENNPYIISSPGELAFLEKTLNSDNAILYADKHYIFTNSLNYGGHSFSVRSDVPFTGSINGQGNLITNIIIEDYFIKNIQNASISNLQLSNISYTTNLNETGVFALNDTSSSFDMLIINASVTGADVSGFSLNSTNSNFNNIVINNNYNANSVYDLSKTTNSTYLDVAIKQSSYDLSSSSLSNNGIHYFTSNNGLTFLDSFNLNSLTSSSSYMTYDNDFEIFMNEESNNTSPLYSEPTFTYKESGVDNENPNVLHINNLKDSWNYYKGLNYVSSSSGNLPSGNNQNLYNENNLVKVKLTYLATDLWGNAASVSLTESYNTFVYYDFYPVENNQIKIPLIDNPFSNRPNDMGFNGWVFLGNNGYVYLDKAYYQRYLVVDTNGSLNDLDLTVRASWIPAKVYTITGTPTWSTVFTNLDTYGLHQITTTERQCTEYDMGGYYLYKSVNRNQRFTGYYYSGNRYQYVTNQNCTSWGGCNYYEEVPNGTLYEEENTYYSVMPSGNSYTFTVVNPSSLNISCGPVDLYASTDVMAGYFASKTFTRNQSISGYYNTNGEYQTGTCTSNSCTYYEYLDYYNSLGNVNTYDSTRNYYYLATRDTNIVVLRANFSNNTLGTTNTKPFTLTGLWNGVLNNRTWTFSTTNLTLYADTAIEYVTFNSGVRSGTTYPGYGTAGNNISRYGNLVMNYKNVKLGRGILNNGTNRSFATIVGGANGNSGSSNNNTKYQIIVESGFYNSASWVNPASNTSNVYIDNNVILGSDIDRVLLNNNKLEFYFCVGGSWGGYIYSSNQVGLKQTVKSGSFGTSKSDLTTGIYVGGRHTGTQNTARSLKVEGGYIYNVIGGPLSASGRADVNDIYFYQTGGEIEMITGGAGTSATYGNRILSITGGKVLYSVFAGSNGSDGTEGDGTLEGTGFIYIGGDAQIGDQSLIDTSRTLYGAESGSVFGIGNGKSGTSTIGSSRNSNIIVDGGTILNSVYGGGNYGATGVSSNATTNYTKIHILDGIVNGNVYGGGNQNGSGSNTKTSTITITMDGGLVKGNIYGGSNISGTIYGDTILNINYGTVNGNIYGGGKGQNTSVRNNVNVLIGSNNTSPTIDRVYGGSALGTVNGIGAAANTGNTTVTVNNGIIQYVFGGGEGNNTISPRVFGNIDVYIEDGDIGKVFGGNDLNGAPSKNVNVYLNGGNIGEAYGGGNETTVTQTHVYQNGSNSSIIYGGSNLSGNITTTNVVVTGGTSGNIFGGNNAGGSVNSTNVTINNGQILNAVYGGGNAVDTSESNIILNGSNGLIPYVYGGGYASGVGTVQIDQLGTNVDYIFGGSNSSGTIVSSTINHNSGTTNNIYGGNNLGGNVIDTTINYISGTSENIYVGGNNAPVDTGRITVTTGTIENIYGGGNNEGILDSTIVINNGNIDNIYGGANNLGNVDNTRITINNGEIENVYGGNNAGGYTGDSTITINDGEITNLYGGGNFAEIEKTNITVIDGQITNLYGGGNRAEVATNTFVDINGGLILENIYGGGNEGVVNGNSVVYITDATVNGSAYAGGNGTEATVIGNSLITIDGNSVIGTTTSVSPVSGCVFGGGKAAMTGLENSNTSVATVNIAGATIYGNVYGGANTSIVNGSTLVYIGYNAIPTSSSATLTKDDIYIKGTIFGGGESNAEGSENFSFDFKSVTVAINIFIDGLGHNSFVTEGSIFGSGNASSSLGTSEISIKNYGTFNNPARNISIQRTDILTIDNSNIYLSGASDRTNDYSDVLFSLSIIEDLKLKNNSTLFLENNANLLQHFESLDANGNKAYVTIDEETGNIIKNTDNRLYMVEGQNLNIATNQNVTAYGQVDGMTFFGLFTKDANNTIDLGLYSPNYEYGDEVDWGDLPLRGSYILGLHKTNHDVTIDGFYSNFMNEDSGLNEVNYVIPADDTLAYYMWIIGSAVVEYSLDLTASKYSTLGSTEFTFINYTDPNTSFTVIGFETGELAEGISLIDKNQINKIAPTQNEANNVFGLMLESSNSGWLTSGETNFLTSDPKYTGIENYIGDNTSSAPSFLFYLYHSKNITESKSLGTASITFLVITKISALESETSRVVLNINMNTQLYDTTEYEAAMTPGDKYQLFSSTSTNITSKSKFSAYYSLYASDENVYKNGYYRTLTSSLVLPEGTKLTLIDFINGNPQYYYHIINNSDVVRATSEYNSIGEASYDFSNFTQMGSLSQNAYYNDSIMNGIYYDGTDSFEEFIVIVDFENANIVNDTLNNYFLIELKDSLHQNQVVLGVLGIQQSSMIYSLYTNKDANIELISDINDNPLYVGYNDILSITSNYTYSTTLDSSTIFDTTNFDSKLGLKISFLDSNGDKVSGTDLLGLYFTLNNKNYYPTVDGVTRIKIADKVGNVQIWPVLNTEHADIITGNYTMQLEVFSSPDGIYYSNSTSDYNNIDLTIINSIYGLTSTLNDKSVIIDSATGKTLNEDNLLSLNINYMSSLDNPNIRVKLNRRKYNYAYDNNYEAVDLLDYITNPLAPTSNSYEYTLIANPQSSAIINLSTKTELLTGTYRFDICLYDDNTYIGKVSHYFIIKEEW